MLARPLKDAAGTMVGHVGSVEDVTEHSRLQAFLDRTGRLAGVGALGGRPAHRRVTWSDETRRLHAVGPGFVPTLQNALEFIAPEGRADIEAAIKTGIERGIPWDLELPLIDAAGRRLWVRALGEVVTEGGVPVRLVGALQDITEQRDTTRALRREQAVRTEIERHARATEELLREREDMLDVLAHEVRQPLNNASAALQGAVAVLDEAGQATAATRLVRAQSVLGQVLASIDNNLAVASLLARRDAIERSDTDIDALLAVTRADLPAGDRDRVRVARVTPTRTATMDMSLMRLALRNLLANALRYSPPGSPVETRLSDLDEPLAFVIDVVDVGPGIPEAELARLFQRGASRARGAARAGQRHGPGPVHRAPRDGTARRQRRAGAQRARRRDDAAGRAADDRGLTLSVATRPSTPRETRSPPAIAIAAAPRWASPSRCGGAGGRWWRSGRRRSLVVALAQAPGAAPRA